MADVDNESDVSFESADEGDGITKDGEGELLPENRVSENVKKKADLPEINESPSNVSPAMQEPGDLAEVTDRRTEEVSNENKSDSNKSDAQHLEGVDLDLVSEAQEVIEEPRPPVVSDDPPKVAGESEIELGKDSKATSEQKGAAIDAPLSGESIESERQEGGRKEATKMEEERGSEQVDKKEGAAVDAPPGEESTGNERQDGPETEGSTEEATKIEERKESEQEDKREAAPSPVNQAINRTDPSEEVSGGGGPSASEGTWSSWGGSWSGWGSSLYSSATATVSAVSGSVGKVIGSVEASAGIPPAEDLATTDETRAPADETKGTEKKETDADPAGQSPAPTSPGGAVGSLFSYGASAITTVVGKTVTGGLDALEVIGKKTMDVLQEGDPGLKKTRAYFGGRKDGQNLSQMLREAKEESEQRAQYEEEEEERQKCHFGWLFEQNQGLAHLEALEILSNESEMKVEAVVGVAEDESDEPLKTELMEIKDAFELEDIETEEADDDADFVNTITEHLFGLSIAATPDKLKRVQTDAHEWLTKLDGETEGTEGETEAAPGAKEIHQKAMQVLADLTARSIEQFHKTGELLLLKQVTEENKSPIQQATSLSKLTSALCAEVSFVASKFSEKLSRMAATCTDGSGEAINSYVTNIFLEASNSTSYIQDAFQLLLPVMQVVAINQQQES